MSEENILDIRHLRTSFFQEGSELRAVDDLSYTVKRGSFVAIIGESGSGKSVSALSILRLIAYPPGIIKDGEIWFKSKDDKEPKDLLTLSDAEMRKLRGKEISMIFQEPSSALNPVMTIGNQIIENIMLHTDMNKQEATKHAEELLTKVDIPNADTRLKDYPFQFSGGMQQRAMIAMAMSCSPDLLIADEPTTALDVTVQAQVLEQLNNLRKEYGTTLILITHNLGIVARYADEVKIMYGGKLVEQGTTVQIFRDPHHPYTVGLIKAVPRLDRKRTAGGLYTIEGEPPDMSKVPYESCAFAARCKFATEECRTKRPPETDLGDGHSCSCFHMEGALKEREVYA